MTSEKKRILIVDDSTTDIHVLMENLAPDYAVLAATSGEKALELASGDSSPDVILLDVMMPEVDGYETCRRLKKNPATRDIDVIFVSGHDTTEEKLAGYDAGGSDYLIKPVQSDELLRKIKLAIENKEARLSAKMEQTTAMQAAMTAMSNAGELGVVINFMRNSFTVDSTHELARLIVEATANYGLENSVQIRTAHEEVCAGSKEPVPPLEQELLSRLKDAGRILEKGTRLILNFGNISQLIKNMPGDEEKCGRLRDHLAILIEGAVARLKALGMQNELARVVEDSNEALRNIEAMQKEQKQAAMHIMDDVLIDLESSFLSYGLTEDQEKMLLDVVKSGVDRSLENFEQGIKLDEQFRGIIERLTRVSAA